MGLPGSGKTTLANELGPLLNAERVKHYENNINNGSAWIWKNNSSK